MFGTPVATQDPKFVETILGKTGSQNLYDRAFNNSLLNTALMWAVLPKREGYGSAFDPRYIARAAVFGGIPAYQSTIGQGVENFKTMRDIAQQERQYELDKYKATTTNDYNDWLRAQEGGYKGSYIDYKALPNALQKAMYEANTGMPWGTTTTGANASYIKPETEKTKQFIFTPPDGGPAIPFPSQEALDAFIKDLQNRGAL